MKTILVLEDNDNNREMLLKIIADLDMKIDLKETSNQKDALDVAMKYNVDLFLVDIILDSSIPGDVSGMTFAENIRMVQKYKYTPIIFVTALEDPGLHAYSDIHCYYYIEKPFDPVNASKMILEALKVPKEKADDHNVYFRKDGILYKKNISDIVYIENSRSGLVIYCTNGNLKLSYRPNKLLMNDLHSGKFLRCNRYNIVNTDYIEEIDTVNRYIKMKNAGELLEIGIAFKKKFLEELGEYGC